MSTVDTLGLEGELQINVYMTNIARVLSWRHTVTQLPLLAAETNYYGMKPFCSGTLMSFITHGVNSLFQSLNPHGYGNVRYLTQ